MNSRDMKPGGITSISAAQGCGARRWSMCQAPGKYLRIDITGTGKHTTITNNPSSERYHRTLFRDLRAKLVENGCWSFGQEGAEIDEPDRS
jgi:hypothetical protein